MRVEIEVYSDEGRGAWVKARHDGSQFTSAVTGDCEKAVQAEWQADFPRGSDGGGASPNGQPIDDPLSLMFTNGRARLVKGEFKPFGPNRDGWMLVVEEKLR